MRTNCSSSFGSTYNMEDAVSPTSSTAELTWDMDGEVFRKLRSYGKFFTIKLLQILVQARTNERHEQPCIGLKGKEPKWFNLNLDELGEVSAQVKRSLPKYPPEVDAICVDFYLYTADSDTLPLETWTFHINREDKVRPDTKSEMSELYHQLTTLLKSTAAAARMTPMHRYYVKKQSADTFVILYKVQPGLPTVNLGPDSKTKLIGSFPSPMGAFTLTLAYRTRMEIEQKLVQSAVVITPETLGENTDSFQKVVVGSCSSANTPDYENVVNSPRSIDAISHFSISPPAAHSPGSHPPLVRGASQRSNRSRTCSLASEPESEVANASPKERMHSSQSMPVIPKNMPFANLLTLSYTGTPLPLHSVPEEKDKASEEENEALNKEPLAQDEITEEQRPENIMEHSQETVVDDVMNETMKPPSVDKAESEDDDSFVKIPAYGNCEQGDTQGLNEFIATCKFPQKLESFGENDVVYILSQLDSLSSSQGAFDQFISSIRAIEGNDENN